MANGRDGFQVSHDDLSLLSCCDPGTFKRFMVSVNEYTQWLEVGGIMAEAELA